VILTVAALTGVLTLTLKLLLAVIRLLEIVANPGSRHVILIIGIYLKIFIIYRPLHRRFSGWRFIGVMAMRFFNPDVYN
jgi:hypothetical protein